MRFRCRRASRVTKYLSLLISTSPFDSIDACLLASFYPGAHYHVTINISSNNESMNYGGEVGMFSIRVVGVNKKITKRIVLNESSIYYEPGSNHSAVVSGEVVGRIDAVELTWEYQTQMFNPLTWRVNKPKAYIDSLTIKSLEFNEV